MKKIISALLVIMLVLSMIPVTALAAETVTATLSFADKAQRTSFSSTQQVWEQNGVKLTNDKAASSNAVADYASPVRLYANSNVIIEYPGMTKIEIAVNASKYVSPLTGSTFSSGTVTASGNTVTIVFAAPTDSLTITKLSGQTRFNSLTVTAVESSGDTTCEHTNVAENADGKAATCTETGLTNSFSCADCGETVTYQQVIDALGHDVVDGFCTRCGEEQVVYDLVTDVTELTTGSQVVIVAAEYDVALSIIQANNNRQQAAIEKTGTQVIMNDNVQVLTVGAGTVANTYSFHTGEGYLYAADSNGSQNYLRTKADLDATGSFTVEITEAGVATIKAQGNVAKNWLRYNDASKIFSCYGETSTQKDIAIYKLAGSGNAPVECDHPSSTAQNNAVAPTCTGVGYTATETCDTCGAITKPAEEIPALGHDFVDYSCSVCLATDPESPLTATRIKNQLPANGDKILFYHYSSKLIMSDIADGTRLVGVSATVADGALPYGASAAVLTVGITEDDEFYFVTESGKYLATGETGGNLILAEELDDLSLWTVNALEAGSFNIISNGACYNDAYNQAIECYYGNFTTFGLGTTAAYQIDFYLVEAAPVCEHTNTKELEDGKEPTCTETGLTKTVVCADCGEVVTAQTEIPAYGHAWVEQEAVDATCIHTGHIEHFECCVCLVVSLDKETLLTKEDVQLPVNPDAHAWNEGVYTEPTTEADGYTTYTCGLCAAEEVEIDEGSKLPPVVVENAIVKQPENVTVDSGNDVQFKVETTGEVVSYKWEYRKLYKWFSTTMAGYNTDTLTVAATGQRNNYGYRCVITFADGTVLTSEEAKLTVKTYMGITYHPNDQVVVLGYKGQFTAAAEGEGIKYQWQYCRPGSELWIDTAMEGATKPTVMIETTTARDGYMYRCKITDVTGNEQFTEVATMRVLSFTSHPVETFAATDATVQFTVATSVPEGFSYQWQYRRSATGSWSDTTLTGYNTATLTVPAEGKNGYEYRCVLTGSKNSKIESKGAVLHVGDPVVITTQPADVTCAVGEVAIFTVEATNAYAYQWQYCRPGSTTWKNTTAEGNQTATLQWTAKATNNGYKIRCVVYGLDGVDYNTEAATLTIG